MVLVPASVQSFFVDLKWKIFHVRPQEEGYCESEALIHTLFLLYVISHVSYPFIVAVRWQRTLSFEVRLHWGVLVFMNFSHFSAELKETGSLGATESEVWIGNLNVKAWKTTEHKLHKIWCSLKFCKNSAKRAHPWAKTACLPDGLVE